MATIAEHRILKPRDPSIEDSNEWEQFQLTGVEVRNATTNELSSMLLADAHNPLSVMGRLGNVEPEQAHLLLHNSYARSPSIQIDHVTQFAYGETDDHEIVIWIAGKAGWYQIEPARSYKSIFADMLEAVRVLYFLADYYQDGVPKGKGGARGCEELFQTYADENSSRCDGPADAIAIFHKHRDFLLLSMVKNAEDLQWTKVPLYVYLKKKFPESFDAVYTRMYGSGDKPKFPKQVTSHPISATAHDTQSITSASTGSRRRGRPRKNPEIQYETSISGSSGSRDSKNKQNHEAGQKRRVGRPSKGSEFVSQQSDDSMLAPSETNSSDDSPAQQGRRGHKGSKGKGKGKGKSALRPKTMRLSLKGANDYTNDPFEDDNNSSEDILIGDIQDNSPSVPTGRFSPSKRKLALLGTSASSKIISNNNEDDRPSKRPASRDSPNTASYTPNNRTHNTKPPPKISLPLKWKDPNSSSRSPLDDTPLVPPITSTPIPSLEPNGPGGSWSCTFDGCMHRVYGGNSEVGRQLIREHYSGHVVEKQAQIELIMREERPHLPVNNLLKRIREIAEKQQQQQHQSAKNEQQPPQNNITSLAMRSIALIERSY